MPPESGLSPSLVLMHHYREDDAMGVNCDIGKPVPVSKSVLHAQSQSRSSFVFMDNFCDYTPLSIYNYVQIIILLYMYIILYILYYYIIYKDFMD